MGEVVAFRDPQADLQGEELERVLSVAREFAGALAGDTLWYGMGQLSRQPGCGRLGVESLGAVMSRALIKKVEELNLLPTGSTSENDHA